MFGRRSVYTEDVVGFAEDLLNVRLCERARIFARAAQRGYRRASLTQLPPNEAWPALAVVQLWRAVCHPKDLQLVMAGTPKSGQAWLRYLERICSNAKPAIRETVLFAADKESVYTEASGGVPVMMVLRPQVLAVGPSAMEGARRVVMVMPHFDRVPTRWLPAVRALADGAQDQWLTVLPDES